jgi:glyoxylase-like metal-dependent hydrolase (beta-lactamase superfamily II)
VLFDLGVRRDWENYAPSIVDLIDKTTRVHTQQNVADILDSAEGVSGPIARSKDIEAVIWSHHHFDHIGDPSTFPPSTELVVGPGVRDLCWPGFPTRLNAPVLDSDIAGRTVREIDFTAASSAAVCKVGGFDAWDYFGDGSFYLLDAPGHSVGHLCALARVTHSQEEGDSFVFMGADACHHPGVLRPTAYLPLPVTISPSPIAKFRRRVIGCPGEILQQIQPERSAVQPFFNVSRKMFPDHDAASETVRKIQELDAADNVFVIIAHDGSLLDQIDLYPNTINTWKAKGLRSKTRWLFCRDFDGAVE